ncbi:MAG: Hsp20/alpha crystallin family protein [Candidatus Promineifilaceae bacterium]
MTSLIRWNPIDEMLSLHEEIDNLFDMAANRFMRGDVRLDFFEKGKAYIVEADIPGVAPEDLDVQVSDHVLTIRGVLSHDDERRANGYFIRERHMGHFYRSIVLPQDVDEDGIQAEYRHGVLRLTLPKVKGEQPRRIRVRSKQIGVKNGRFGWLSRLRLPRFWKR